MAAASTLRPQISTSLLSNNHRPEQPQPPVTVKPRRNTISGEDSLKSTAAHRAWLAGGCATVALTLAKSAALAAESHVWAEPLAACFAGYLLSDLGSGVYHWAIDNYGDGGTPLFGGQIEGFQGHHRRPTTITRREVANNLHSPARAVALAVLPAALFSGDAAWLGFVGFCSGCLMFSQQFHAWAHAPRRRLPRAVAALQDSGILVSRAQHGAHHRAPYNGNYCIVSGVWNDALDGFRVFEAMEMVIFFRSGVRPRSWEQPSSDWTAEEDEEL